MATTNQLHRKPQPLTVVPHLLRATYSRLLERTAGACVDPAQVPAGGTAVTERWLAGVLGEPISSVRYEVVSAGTSERGRLRFVDSDGVHRQLFVKSTPTLMTRFANGATGTSRAEAAFFRDLRHQLGAIRIPHGYHSAFDERSLRSIHLLEDLAATGPVSFPTAADSVTRRQVESALDLLAEVHRTFQFFKHPQVRTYRTWWETNLRVANVRGAVEKIATDDFCPGALADPARLWAAAVASIEAHDGLVPTLLHGDPHLGNWYFAGPDQMGLLDWQCVSAGHWSRDVAYAMTTLLTVEQRRSWEDDLVARYHGAAQLSESLSVAKDRYRSQIPGALLMWAPTLHRPRGFPEMQPEVLSRMLLTRILTAMGDHGAATMAQA